MPASCRHLSPPPTVRLVTTRQIIRGAFASISGLPDAVNQARKALGLTWEDLAAGSPWSRQYLQRHLREEELQAPVVEHLTRRLGLAPSLTITSPLIQPQPT